MPVICVRNFASTQCLWQMFWILWRLLKRLRNSVRLQFPHLDMQTECRLDQNYVRESQFWGMSFSCLRKLLRKANIASGSSLWLQPVTSLRRMLKWFVEKESISVTK